VDVADVRDSLDDMPCLGIEDDHLAVAQVRDEQQMPTCVQARIVESCRMTTEGYIGN